MSKNVKFVLNRKAFGEQILQRDELLGYLVAIAEGAKPSGPSIEVRQSTTPTRARVTIWDTSAGAMFREAREGHLSSALGISAGDRKVWYTTKAGKRRLATAAQVRNWSRGR